jgi:threonine dehydratase
LHFLSLWQPDDMPAAAPPALVQLADVQAAADRIVGDVLLTPVVSAGPDLLDLQLKAECLQPTGAFKLRGASNAVALLDDARRAAGVVTHSSGNHGQALARAASRHGVRCTVVMPQTSVQAKIDATRAWGAHVELVPEGERGRACAEIAARTGATVVPPYEDVAVIAGQGTVGLEICRQVPDVQTVLVPVGGGGLISGVAVAVKATLPHVRVIGIEPEVAGDAAASFAEGTLVTWEVGQTSTTVADGLRAPGLGAINFEHVRALVDAVLTVSEQQILDAVRRIAHRSRLVAEPSGAVTTAGYLAHADGGSFGRTVAIVSGGNVDAAAYARMLA